MAAKIHTVTLSQPIVRGKTSISEVEVAKPSVGALRGMALSAVLTMDVDVLIKLLPRITRPALLPDEVAGLDPADFTALSVETLSFFATEAQLAALQGR